MSPDEIRERIESQVVDLIKLKVENEEMTEERAQQLAQRVLELLKPGMSLEDLYKALPKLDDNFSEASPIIVPYLRDYEDGVTKKPPSKYETSSSRAIIKKRKNLLIGSSSKM